MILNDQPAAVQAAWPAALASRPLLVYEPAALQVRDAWMEAERIDIDRPATPAQAAAVAAIGEPGPRYRTVGGVAVIPITGPLISRGNWLGERGYTSYDAIQREARLAIADPAVHSVVTAINSPGGTVDGILGAAGAIRAIRQAGKPVVAHVTSMAASAGYWLAAQSDEIVLADDLAMVGSIGVYTMHIDLSGLLEKFGLNVSLISSGRHKVDGHPFGPLPADVRGQIQTEVDDLRLMFAREVAAGRPTLTSDLALRTEARVFRALNPRTGDREAITEKLADRVDTLDAVVGSLTRRPRGGSSNTRKSMTIKDGAAAADNSATFTQADLDRARAEGAAASATRIAGILDHAEASGREQLARHLAFKTSMPADEAAAVLAATPKAETAVAAAPAVVGPRAGDTSLGLVVDTPAAAQPSSWSGIVSNLNKQRVR